MKRNLILFILSFLTLTAFGQNPNPTAYFKAGLSFPMFDLAKGNPMDTISGLAGRGLHVEVGYQVPLSKHWGTGLAALYYGNRYSQKKFYDFYGNLLSDAAYGIKTNYAWSVGGLVLKPDYFVRLQKNISWEIYATGGFLVFFTPEYVETSKSLLSSTTYVYHKDRNKGISFAYGFGTRFNFSMFSAHLFLDADFLASNIKYNSTGTDWNGNTFSIPVRQRIGYFSVNLGYTIYL